MVLNGLTGLYGLKYDSAPACRLPLYLCSYKLVISATNRRWRRSSAWSSMEDEQRRQRMESERDREKRVSERREGTCSFPFIELGGRGGTHARARGSHVVYGTCAWSDDGVAPEAFKIDQNSTESPNFSPLYLPISCCSGSNFLTKSSRTICGEQLCFKDHGLVQHGYEDTSLQSRVYETKN